MNKKEINKTLSLLREPFSQSDIDLLPRPAKSATKKSNCEVCGNYHAHPSVHLEYVGHAALTDRLLDVDENWNWEPLALDENGLPAMDKYGGLWIRLTVLGLSRYGYGDSGDKSGPNAIKEAIGDALRNAAMRFGAALELWRKGEQVWSDENGKARGKTKKKRTKTAIAADYKSFVRKMVATTNKEALDEFIHDENAQAFLRELRDDWTDEYNGLKKEKELHMRRIKNYVGTSQNDIDLTIESFEKDIKSANDDEEAKAMFELAKFNLLNANASPDEIKLIEEAFDTRGEP